MASPSSSPFGSMFSKKTKLGSPKPFSPATIDERHSFNAALEQQEEAPPISSLLVTPKDATSLSTGLTVHAMRLWDIKMGPIKKHMVGSRLVPTVRQVAFFNNKIRKISVEIQGPPTSADKTPPQLQTLQDGQVVFLRVFKRSRRGATTPSAATENGDDDDDDMSVASTVIGGDIQELAANAMIDGWREHRSYKLEDVHILSQNKNTRVLEVKLGSGQETMVRDFRFENEEDSKSFRAVVDSINQMEQERSQRQLAKYKESKVAAAAKTSPTGASSAKAVQEDSVGQEMIQILVEIVSAIDLPEADLSSADPYVIVRMGGKEIHRTAVIAKNLHPIWTLSEGSLFLLRMTPEEFFASSGGMTFVIKDFDQIGKNEILGNVFVPLEDLLKGTGERMEYEVKPEKVTKPKPGAKQGKLYLRFREASADDIAFMDVFSKRSDRVGVFSEETIVPLRPPSSKLLKRQVKRGEHKEKLFRVRPYPDPNREEETSWMTKEGIIEESMKPSTYWIEAGSGDVGKVYFEVLACQDLPNMDLNLTTRDQTDAFACIAFEDALVHTDVIGDTLSPRWMPWCQRAFVFNISHPSSSLYIGVFDHDHELSPMQLLSRAAADLHDPVGRVQIHLSNFAADTDYTLAYPLYYGEIKEQRKKVRGTLWVRMRVEWGDRRRAIVHAAMPPARNYVSVARSIDFQVAHYTTEGPFDDKDFDINTLSRYVEELQSYDVVLDYLKEAALCVWLWRGHFPVRCCNKEYRLPLHSICAFVWGMIVTYDFNTLPSFFLFSIGWGFLACNEFVNQCPSPWLRVPPYWVMWWAVVFNHRPFEFRVKPNEFKEQFEAFEKEQSDWLARRKRVKELEAKHEEELRKELGEEIEDAAAEEVDITSAKGRLLKHFNVNPLKPILYPVQLQLGQIVIALRIAKSIVMWEESYYAFWIVTLSILGSVALFWVPFGFILRWLLRVVVFVVLGPWMAIVDRIYFREKPDMTDAERDEEVRQRLRARFAQVVQAASQFQIRKERALKLKSFKNFMYGRYHLRVPRFSEDAYKDVPLQESFAEPYVKTDKEIEIALKKHGQNLTGDMIPMREIQESELKSEHKTAPSLWRRLKRTGKETTSVGEKIPLLGPVVFGRRNKKNYDAVAMEEAKGEEEPLLAEDGKTE